jgi:hypothetical protein
MKVVNYWDRFVIIFLLVVVILILWQNSIDNEERACRLDEQGEYNASLAHVLDFLFQSDGTNEIPEELLLHWREQTEDLANLPEVCHDDDSIWTTLFPGL